MLIALLLLSLAQINDPLPASHACESATVQRPEMVLSVPEWGFVVRPETACEPSTGVAALMYSLGIDAAVPVVGEEYAGDVYAEDESK